jgi:hypothetical protein
MFMGCFGPPRRVYTLHTVGIDGNVKFVFVFSTLENAIEHALRMQCPERKWITECTIDKPGKNEIRIWSN